MNLPTNVRPRRTKPLVILSTGSSHRSFELEPHREFLQTTFPETEVVAYNLKDWELKEQLEAVADAAIYISIAGGGTFTAMFLPKGASLVLYYTTGLEEGPARLDYDFWNNLGYLRVHWLPFVEPKKPAPPNDAVLEALVRHELQVLMQQNVDDADKDTTRREEAEA